MHLTRSDASGGLWCSRCGCNWARDDEPPQTCEPAATARQRHTRRQRNQRVYQEEMAKIQRMLRPT